VYKKYIEELTIQERLLKGRQPAVYYICETIAKLLMRESFNQLIFRCVIGPSFPIKKYQETFKNCQNLEEFPKEKCFSILIAHPTDSLSKSF
jgi:hypothetical protein